MLAESLARCTDWTLQSCMSFGENFIDCRCPYCGESVSFRDNVAGSAQECPNCTESLIVPLDTCDLAGKIPLPMATARLNLRRLTMSDQGDLLEFLSDEALFEYLESPPPEEEQIIRRL